MSDPRFSIIPAAAVLDPRLEPRDLQVLCVFGRHIDRRGWCRRSQVQMAKEMNCARSTVQAAIDRLVAAGWLEKRASGDVHVPGVRDSASEYRVVLDVPDDTQDVVGTPADLSAPLPTNSQSDEAKATETGHRHPPAPPAGPGNTGVSGVLKHFSSAPMLTTPFNEKKESSSISKGRAASPQNQELVVAGPGEPEFEAVAKLRGKPPIIGKSGRSTLSRAEVDEALAKFPAAAPRSRVAASEVAS